VRDFNEIVIFIRRSEMDYKFLQANEDTIVNRTRAKKKVTGLAKAKRRRTKPNNLQDNPCPFQFFLILLFAEK